ncbi:MAG: hypothetical protein IKR04_05470 [Clostridia bacterium]|nr:hypothetical protein [Clostridia bacterium]
MVKKISLFILLIVLTFSLSVAFADDGEDHSAYDEGYEQGFKDGKDRASSRTPVVRLQNPKEVPTANPGEIMEYTFTYKNESDYPAKNLVITPIIEDDKILVYERPLVYKSVTGLKARKEETNSFKIKINENAKKGTYPIKIKFEYSNSIGDTFTREETGYFQVVSEKSKPILTVSNIKYSKNSFSYGDKFNVMFDVTNIGADEAKDVEIRMEGFENNTIMPQNSLDYSYVGVINGKESNKGNVLTQGFPLVISENIEVHDVTLKIIIDYKGYDDKDYKTEKSIYVTGIKVKEKESGDKKKEEEEKEKLPKPKVIISSYGIAPQNITAGDEFTFTFNLKNTSREKPIRNIKFTVGSKDGSFIITKGSNTFYLEKMDIQETIYRQIDLKAKQDLLSNSYEINISISYEDYDGEEFSSTESVNVPVTEYSKVSINSANVEDGYVGNNTSLSFQYANLGKATVSNLIATVRGDYEPVQEETYIGNVQAGNSDYYDIEVRPTKEGLNSGMLVLTYEDSSGKRLEVVRAVSSNAYAEEEVDPSEFIDLDTEMGEENEGPKFEAWQIVLAGIGSFVVVFIVTKFITKKIILKKFEKDL